MGDCNTYINSKLFLPNSYSPINLKVRFNVLIMDVIRTLNFTFSFKINLMQTGSAAEAHVTDIIRQTRRFHPFY